MTHSIGDLIFDLPSRCHTTIREVSTIDGAAYYRVGENVPRDPTDNGTFNDRWRCDSEILSLDTPPSIRLAAYRGLRATWG